MKYYIISGEASGDIHGANLLNSLQKKDDQATFRFWGGDSMSAIAGPPVKHIRELAFMGFWEVLIHLKTIVGLLRFCKQDITAFSPDVIILIDYPGFNLRIAHWAKLKGYKVVYYIVPQVWAWHQSRVKILKASTDRLIAILPFEEKFFLDHGCSVSYVGHPLLDEIAKSQDASNEKAEENKKIKLALLPGSRKQEVKHMLPVFLRAAELLKLNCVIAASNNLPLAFYEDIVSDLGLQNIQTAILPNQVYHILKNSSFSFVTSGTATLETALFKVPQVVGYKGNAISYYIAKRLVKLKYISLVNLILNRELVKELIQEQLTSENLVQAYRNATSNQATIKEGYDDLQKMLGYTGASDRAADIVYEVATS